jgi:hypothetical protein
MTRFTNVSVVLLSILALLIVGQQATSLAQPASPGSATTKPVLHWAFDGDCNDSSIAGNHGKLAGEGIFVEGKWGQAISRKVGARISIPSAKGLPMEKDAPFSMNLWVRSSEIPGWSQIAGFRDGTSDWGTLRVIGNWNGFSLFAHNAVTESGKPFVVDGEWHMYTIVWDGTKVATYIDATPHNAKVPTGDSFTGLTALKGDVQVFVGDDQQWQGSIDEFTIWSVALNADQIKTLHQKNILE